MSEETLLDMGKHLPRGKTALFRAIFQAAFLAGSFLLLMAFLRRKLASPYPLQPAGLITPPAEEEKLKKTEAALQFYQYLLHNTEDPVYWISPEDNFQFIYVNEATCRLFGLPAEKLLNTPVPDWNPAYTIEKCRTFWEQLREKKRTVFESRYYSRSGDIIPLEVSATVLHYEGKDYFGGFIRDISGRERAENTLRESEERYRSLFQSNKDSLFLVDMETFRLVDANPAACRTYGYTREEFLRLRATDISAEPEKTIEAFRSRVQFMNQRNHRRRDGSVFPIEGGYNYLTLNGRECSIVTIRDVSEQKEAERKLLELRLRLEGIIDSAMDAIITVDEHSRIVMFNATAESIFHYTEAEILGSDIAKLLPADLRDWFRNKMQQQGTGEAFPATDSRQLVRALRRHGEEFPVDSSLSQINVSGKNYFTITIRDITERERNRQTLEEEKQRLELAIFSADLGLWDWDIFSGRVLYSDRWASMLGYDTSELAPVYSTWAERVHPDDISDVVRAMDELFNGNSSYYRTEHRLLCRNGEWKWVLASGKVISRDSKGAPRRVIGTHLDITSRKQSEDEIRKLAMVAQTTDNAVIITGASGIIQWVNKGFTAITGFTPEEAIGRKPGDFLQGPATDPETIRLMSTAIRQGKGFNLEIQNYTKSRVVYWLHLSVQPVFDENGTLQHFVAIESDISRRKKAEEQLHFQASVLQSVKDSLVVTDLEGRITYFNQGAETIFGYSAAEMMGKNNSILYPEPYLKKLEDNLGRIMGGVDFTGEWQGRRKDNATVWVDIQTSLLRDAAGKPVGFLGVAKNITDRKLAEKKLRESEANLRAIFDASVQTYFLVDPSYRILNFNRAAAGFIRQSYGIELREGDNLLDFVDPKTVPDIRRNVTRAFGGEKVVVTVQVDHPGRPGLWVEDQYLPTYDDAGQVFAVAFVALDVTERKSAVEAIMELNASLERRVAERTAQLQSINHELEAFSYSVSHDLRAPLRTIDGFSEVVLEDYFDKLDEEGRESLKSIRTATRRMSHLIDDMLKLSKITRGDMYSEPVDLTGLIYTVEQELRAAEPLRKVSFTVQSGMQVKADVRMLRIALYNLLQNAWKFTSRREEAIIDVGSFRQNGEDVYFVRDNGAGFDMKYVGKLFGAFQRLHSTAEYEGTGIGLATVYRIISRHGGRIWADSATGEGTTFWFTLSPDPTQPTSNG
jgi:PAS domain S-box-containing protein